jgi:hypothetical protein
MIPNVLADPEIHRPATSEAVVLQGSHRDIDNLGDLFLIKKGFHFDSLFANSRRAPPSFLTYHPASAGNRKTGPGH